MFIFFIKNLGWHPYQNCHKKHHFDISFSDPPTPVRNIAPWQTFARYKNKNISYILILKGFFGYKIKNRGMYAETVEVI